MSVSVTLLGVAVGRTLSDARGVFDAPLAEVWIGWEESTSSVVVVVGGELDVVASCELDVVVAGTGDEGSTGMLLDEGVGNSGRDWEASPEPSTI